MDLPYLLAIPGGISWLASYLLIIRRGALDGLPAMPAVALVLNLCWELMYAFIFPDAFPANAIDGAWFVFDVVIAWQYLRYGRREFDPWVPRWLFYPTFLFSLLVAFGLVLGFVLEFDDLDGRYSGWLINMVMSSAFIAMLLRRKGVEGQSLWIGLTRMTGTVVLDACQMLLTPSWPLGGERALGPLLTVMYVATFVLDLAWVLLYRRRAREVGINPWTRF